MARAELVVARAHGTPRSIFLGRVPAAGEPLWLDEDRAWAMALHDLELDTCPGCGQPHSESTLPENEYGYTAVASRCHACSEIRRAQRKFLDGSDQKAADGLTFHVTKDG